MQTDIESYHQKWQDPDTAICDYLFKILCQELPDAEAKVWHGHPVWFLDGNPIAGYSRQKSGLRLMFWSGASFGEEGLQPGSGKFQDASVFYSDVHQISEPDLIRWIRKSREIQWDYKNIVKRKGRLERILTNPSSDSDPG